jgi:acetyl-CoA acetyltransferase
VVFGCAFPEGEQGMNVARMIALRAGLPESVPAETINRYCSSGVQSIAHLAYAIKAGDIEIGIAGGVESMSMAPMMGYKFSPNTHFAQDLPLLYQYGANMENVVKYGVSRQDQDVFPEPRRLPGRLSPGSSTRNWFRMCRSQVWKEGTEQVPHCLQDEGPPIRVLRRWPN